MKGTLLEQMRQEFKIDNKTGDIYHIYKDSTGRLHVKTITEQNFHRLKRNTVCEYNGKMMTESQAYLLHPENSRVDGLTFDPSCTCGDNYINTYQGFGVEPSPIGSWKRTQNHYFEVICNGDKSAYEWLLDWLAQAIQNPTQKQGSAVVIRGEQGCGKSIAADFIGTLFGAHYMKLSSVRSLAGNFNNHLSDAILINLDEAHGLKKHNVNAAMKDLITSKTRLVEPKGIDPYLVPNYSRLIITSNDRNLINAACNERRYLLLEASSKYIGQTEYFDALVEEMENGGYEAMLYDLQHREITSNLRVPPKTEALLEQKITSLKPAERLLLDAITTGDLDGQDIWGKAVPSSKFATLLTEYNHRYSLRGAEMAVSEAFKTFFPDVEKRRAIIGTSKVCVYDVPSLLECRMGLEQHFGQIIEWPKDSGTQSRVIQELIAKVTADWPDQPGRPN